MKKYKTFKDLIFRPTKNGYVAKLLFDNGLGIMVNKQSKYFWPYPKRPYESAMITRKGRVIIYAYHQSRGQVTNFMRQIQKLPN